MVPNARLVQMSTPSRLSPEVLPLSPKIGPPHKRTAGRRRRRRLPQSSSPIRFNRQRRRLLLAIRPQPAERTCDSFSSVAAAVGGFPDPILTVVTTSLCALIARPDRGRQHIKAQVLHSNGANTPDPILLEAAASVIIGHGARQGLDTVAAGRLVVLQANGGGAIRSRRRL